MIPFVFSSTAPATRGIPTSSFWLTLNDLGNGEVNTTPVIAGSPIPTFTRSTAATTINSSGTVVSVTSGVPRSYYNPNTLSYCGFFVEGQRTNLCIYSDNISDASWIKTNISVTPTSTTAPDGSNNGALLTTTGVSNPNIYNGPSTNATASFYTGSVWLKAGNCSNASLQLYQNGIGGFGSLHLTIISGPGSISGQDGSSPIVQGLSQTQWTRVAVTPSTVATASAVNGIQLYIKPNFNSPVIGDTIYVWGAQIEEASFASSYIPTISTSVTRDADILTFLSTMWSNTSGSVYGEFSVHNYVATNPNRIIGTSLASVPSPLALSASGENRIAIWDGTSETATTAGLNATDGNIHKAASSWGGSSKSSCYDGGTVAIGSYSGIVVGGSLIYIGSDTGSDYCWGTIKNIHIWPSSLSSFDLQKLTV